jgi:acyl-CoA dehydrogenase
VNEPTRARGASTSEPRSREQTGRSELRELTRTFTAREVLPHLSTWERDGEVPRSLHATAAKIGLLGAGYPEAVGGCGGDLLDAATITEEIILSGGSSGLIAALFTHGIALPHIIASGDEGLIERYVRPTLAGELIGALAVTEPDGGSDVAAIATVARRDGDSYLLNGAKTFITSGARADFVTVAARTGNPGHRGLSLLVVDRGTPGFTVTRRLDKLGWHCSDTAELSFMEVRVPAANLVGAENLGFVQIMRHFGAERLSLAVQACAIAQRCLDLTVAWCRLRRSFGAPLVDHQVVRHRLAEMARQTTVARAYVWQLVRRAAAGAQLSPAQLSPAQLSPAQLSPAEVAIAKNTAAAACAAVVDAALQLHGGAGYLRESEVERHYRDARIMAIGGGTTEIMNEIIAKGLLDASARQ